jgi:hypothetical protein
MDSDRSGYGLGLPVLMALCGTLMERSTKGGLIVVGSLNLGAPHRLSENNLWPETVSNPRRVTISTVLRPPVPAASNPANSRIESGFLPENSGFAPETSQARCSHS